MSATPCTGSRPPTPSSAGTAPLSQAPFGHRWVNLRGVDRAVVGGGDHFVGEILGEELLHLGSELDRIGGGTKSPSGCPPCSELGVGQACVPGRGVSQLENPAGCPSLEQLDVVLLGDARRFGTKSSAIPASLNASAWLGSLDHVLGGPPGQPHVGDGSDGTPFVKRPDPEPVGGNSLRLMLPPWKLRTMSAIAPAGTNRAEPRRVGRKEMVAIEWLAARRAMIGSAAPPG